MTAGWAVTPRGESPADWPAIAHAVKCDAHWKCIRCRCHHQPSIHRVLTVHHLSGDKANCTWWNLLALCQACHLKIQARVNPEHTYFLEHAPWFAVYAAGFYAQKYLGQNLERHEVEDRLEELLLLERMA